MQKRKAEEFVSEWCDKRKTQMAIDDFKTERGQEPKNAGSP